jgi:hypothetical protein
MYRPGTEVAMGLKVPRISIGASGFGSNVSRWLGPPNRSSSTTEVARCPGLAAPRDDVVGVRRLPKKEIAPT